MRKGVLLAFMMALNIESLAFSQKLEDLIAHEDLKALQQIIVSTIASCGDKIITNTSDLGFAMNELMEVGEGVARVMSESALTLALKKDFPSACHVMTSGMLSDIETSKNKSTKCLVKTPWGCAYKQDIEHPEYSYYWPKYFVEVSAKGNDPHPSFALGNKLYAASRKLANEISGLVDLKGPYGLVAKVIASANAIKTGTRAITGQGFDFDVSRDELDHGIKTAVLTPFEKLRIRASRESDMPSYEVNVWPVGLSASMAQKLTVCEEGGFQWEIPGVPMTCPVAMSRDAWSYWDSGMIDYLNPNAIRGIGAATNPVACIADNMASLAFDEYAPKASTGTVEASKHKDLKKGALSNLPNNYRGLGMCSFPILGDAEAIASQTLGLKDSFKGPWCSLWGSVVPRMSTHVLDTDYGYPLAALKFKLLAHDLFGIPRGANERWSLAYPWEEKVSESFLSNFGVLSEVLEKVGITDISSEYIKGHGGGRSTMLMPPGDPRMMDVFSTGQLAQDSKNFAKEIVYLASMNRAASEAEKQAVNALARETGNSGVDSQEILRRHDRELRETTDETARLKGEPVYRKRIYCHVKGEKRGLFSRDETNLDVPGYGTGAFQQVYSRRQCHDMGHRGKCIKRHRVTGKCQRPESVYWVSVEKYELVRYRKVQNPRRYVVDAANCDYNDWRSPSIHHRHYTCQEKLRQVGQDDTRKYTNRPNPKDPEQTMGSGTDAGRVAGAAARISTWVGAEIARAKYEEISGKSFLPGKKRVYTIFEKVTCEPKTKDGRDIYRKKLPGGWVWNSCEDAVKLEVRKYFQTKLLRRVCDKILNQKLGEPFK